MNWKEYTKKAKTTALYDTREKLVHCTAWSLVEEIDEYFEKEWKHSEKRTKDSLIAMQHELADIAWGLAVLTDHFGYDPSQCQYSEEEFEPSLHCLAPFAKALNKSARDENWEMVSDKRKIPFFTFCDELYNWLIAECVDKRWNFSDILTINIEKLFNRKANGTLSGDGDKRGEER